MIYKVVIPSGKDVRIDEDELAAVVKQMGGKSWVVVKHGIFNPAFAAQIAPAYDIMNQLAENKRMGVEETPSPFAKLLSDNRENKNKLSDGKNN